jgi:hypothetical protein
VKKIVLFSGLMVAIFVMIQRGSNVTTSANSDPSRGAVVWDLSYQEIAAVPDDEVEFFIVQEVAARMPGDFTNAAAPDRPPGVRAVYATWEVEAQVGNGGFDQYFENTDGALADEAVLAFRLFGASGLADLVEQALAQRQNIDALGRLDERFYELGSAQAGRIRFIRQHPESF